MGMLQFVLLLSRAIAGADAGAFRFFNDDIGDGAPIGSSLSVEVVVVVITLSIEG